MARAPPNTKLTDRQAKNILLAWPSSPNKLWAPPTGSGRWIRGQPTNQSAPGPRLSAPGARLFTTQPDGLFAYFVGLESCDTVAIEICGTAQNLNDKRSRYIPSSHSLVLRCDTRWFAEQIPTQGGGIQERWRVAGTLTQCPLCEVAVPVRHLRVLYSLPNALYKTWCPEHTPTGYEFFCPHSSLASYASQKMQTFLRRMSIASQFYLKR